MKTNKTAVTLATLASTLGLGGAAAATASASPTPAPAPTSAHASAGHHDLAHHAMRGDLKAHLDEMVKKGEMTKAKRDAILAHPSTDHHRMMHRGHGIIVNRAARAMNMDPHQLRHDMRQGESIADVAKQHGMSVADLNTKMQRPGHPHDFTKALQHKPVKNVIPHKR